MDYINNLFKNIPGLDFAVYVEQALDHMVLNWGGLLDALSASVLFFVVRIEKFLNWLPWWAWILIVFISAAYLISKKSGAILSFMLFTIGWLGYWDLMVMTVSIVSTAIVFSLSLGIPCGILMARSRFAEKIVHPILDAMQTTPSFVYLLPAVMLFGLGKVPAVFASTIYAVPPVIRMTNLGIRSVSETSIMVADSFGCSAWQKLLKVQLPEAATMILAGINQTTMMSLGMIITSSMVGANGLGLAIFSSIGRLDVGTAFEAGLCIVFVAIILDRLTQGLAKKFSRD
ncbi:ABC transporter permease [Anaeropeptidivorans aminofermentans]|jgi:glycine betaine/proline transport system permease protein|uniref:ABC transporter permease n=1 Tax=Anaeropeptidivorans aminofermentans TaxID=2934315 RepID=UPI000ED4222F|nr:ABC transporter permease subunit [Anaeropeptidivorans aminofermentans]HAQ39385.1 choline ABC transporter permease subunit [Clostridiales bacterium]